MHNVDRHGALERLTLLYPFERVLVHPVVARSAGQTDAVLSSIDGVAANFNPRRLHDGNSRRLHVFDSVVCARRGTRRRCVKSYAWDRDGKRQNITIRVRWKGASTASYSADAVQRSGM